MPNPLTPASGRMQCPRVRPRLRTSFGPHLKLRLPPLRRLRAIVDEEQIAFVSELREERGAGLFHLGEGRLGLRGDAVALGLGQGAPLAPTEAVHLVQGGRAFQREGNGGQSMGEGVGGFVLS